MTSPATAFTRALPRRLAAWLVRYRVAALPLLLAAAVTGAATSHPLYTIKPGDTLSAIAQRYHTTVPRLVALNDLPGNGNLIIAGETLKLPGSASSTGSSPSTGSHYAVTHYTVRAGDSLDGIAARFHVKPANVARRNHLPSSLIVQLGQRLAIARRVHTASAPATSSGSSALGHDWAVLDQRAEPTRPQTQALVRSTAQAWHLDPAFAEAISYQESGFNMREVSPAGAIGAMQVMPYTASYLSTDVVHRSLDIFSAHDNVTAGVALLSLLYNETHSERLAAAGYYQGLGSVRAHGMLPSTKQYVHDVLSLRRGF